MREVEVKFRVLDLDALLGALSSQAVDLDESVVQDDQAYAPVGWEYGQSRIGVPFARLRTVAGRHVFTVKRPAENVLSCEEHESPWQTGRALAAEVSVCVDEVDGLGTFLELERMVPDGVAGEVVQAELAEFAASLGIEAERVEDTYDALIRAVTSA